MIKQTSMEAYEKKHLVLLSQRKQIYNFLQMFPNNNFTRQNISDIMKIPINSVCGRINELIKQGKIIEFGTKTNKYSGVQNYVLKII